METRAGGRPELAVVVGTYNRLHQLRDMIASVIEQTQTSFRIYVTDAGSTDGTEDYLRDLSRRDTRILPFLKGKKIGQARALNEVFEIVESDFVCWLSDDNVVVDRGLDVGVDILRSQPKVGMVGLKVKDVRGPWTHAPYIGGISSLGVLNVNQGMLRTSLLKELGGFAPEFKDYGIDPDLTMRVLYAGWDIVYTRPVAIHHYREWAEISSPEELKTREEKMMRALEIYERKFSYPGLKWHGLGWRIKRQLFEGMISVLYRLGKNYRDRREPIFGLHYRDIHNVFHSRFISIFTLLENRERPYYLRQKGVKLSDFNPTKMQPLETGRGLGDLRHEFQMD